MKKEIDIYFDYSKVKGSTELHNKFKSDFMICVSRRFNDVTVIPYDVGFYRAWSNPDIPVRCGQVGVADTIVFGDKWYLFFDMKTGHATLQANQKGFKARIKEINNGVDRVFKINSIAQGLTLIRISKNE